MTPFDDWVDKPENMMFNEIVIGWILDNHRAHKLCALAERHQDPPLGRIELVGFCVSGRCGTTVQRYQGFNRHMGHDGFRRDRIAREVSAIRHKDSKACQLHEQALCSQAMAPRSRRGKNPSKAG